MACATLKRTLEWEALIERPSKRRRCNVFEDSCSVGMSKPASSSLYARDKSNIRAQFTTSGMLLSKEKICNSFSEATIPMLSPDKITQNLRHEVQRLRKRKQLSLNTTVERMQDSESSGSETGADSPRHSDTPPNNSPCPDKILFTFKQVKMICERMLQEREDQLRETYDAVLNNKLAEQYDAFVKFTYDQIQKRYEDAPSYLS